MEQFINVLDNDMKEILNLLKHGGSKSKRIELLQDYYTLQDIYDELGIKNVSKLEDYTHKKIDKRELFKYFERTFYPMFYSDFAKNQNIYFDLSQLLYELSSKYIINEESIHKSIFKNKINISKSISLSLDFLSQYDLKIYNILIKLIKDNRLFYKENAISNYYGISHGIANNSKLFIIMNLGLNINDSITLVHEAGHIYDFDKIKTNSTKINRTSILVTSCIEIFSNYLELVYKNYLRSQKIYLEDLDTSDKQDIQTLLIRARNLYKNLYYDINVFDIDVYKCNLSEVLGKLCSLYYYEIYLEDQEKAKYYTNLLLENKGLYDNIKTLEKSGIKIDELLDYDEIEKRIQKIYVKLSD